MNKTRLLSPFCVLSCNQSSSLFSGLLCRFRYSPVERFFYKFDGIDCCPKLNAKPVNRLIHWCWQVPPPVNSATHCFFDGCYHLIDGDVAVGLRHSLAPLFRSATAETTSLAGSAAALCAHSKTRCPTSAMGPKPVKLRASKCFPVCPREPNLLSAVGTAEKCKLLP